MPDSIEKKTVHVPANTPLHPRLAPSLPDGTAPVPLGSGVVTALLSKGGTAIVYEIWNAHLEVKRAVKLLDPAHIDQETRERFENEIKITAKLHHANIVEIFAVGYWNNLPYIEMECVDGMTLETLVGTRGALPVEVCTAVGIMVSQAIHYAHNQNYMIYGKEYRGIIHRDLKPGNIMVARDGTVKLMDFGIAKPVTATGRTVEGMVVGTMQYLSPEQLQGGDIDTRADIYSLGSVLYELLTGHRTFPEENLAKLVTDKLKNNYADLNTFAIKCPPRLKSLIQKCLYYEKQRRVQSAVVLVKNLETIHESMTKLPPQELVRQFLQRENYRRQAVSRRVWRLSFATTVQILAFTILAAAGIFLVNFMYTKGGLNPDGISWRAGRGAASEDMAIAPEPLPSSGAGGDFPETSRERDVAAPAAMPVRRTVRREPPDGSRRETVSGAPAAAETTATAGAAQSPQERKNQYVAQMKKNHGTDDLLSIVENLIGKGDHSEACRLSALVPAPENATKKAGLLTLRALQGLGNKKETEKYLLSTNVPDGEFYIAKALYYCEKGNAPEAKAYYDKGMKTPAEFADPEELGRAQMLCRALTASLSFEAGRTAAAKKEAMDAWFDIKSKLRSSPDHPLYKKADIEIRRINAAPANP